MSFKIKKNLKNVVIFIKLLCQLILTRSFGNIIRDLAKKYEGLVDISDLRRLERLWFKTKRAEEDVTFLKNCKLFNVIPKFIQFNIPHAEKFDVIAIRKRLLRSAIKRRLKERKQLQNELTTLCQTIRNKVTGFDWYVIEKAIKNNVSKRLVNVIKTHEKKLANLTRNTFLPFSHKDTVTNLSAYRLNDQEKEILKNGLSFAIRPPFIKKSDVFTSFEQIHMFMNTSLKDYNDKGVLKSKLSHLANSYITSYRPSQKDINNIKILRKLKNNKNIMILKPDKGNGIVVMDRTQYEEGLYKIINDQKKFKKLTQDPTLLREGQLQRFLRKLKTKNIFTNEIYKNIYPNGSSPARIYGLPKMHKPRTGKAPPPLRPIISSIGAFNYNLAKYLSKLITPNIPNQYCISDSFSFVQEIGHQNTTGKILVSFDVASLFTNIPLKETIDLAVDTIINNKSVNIERKELKKLFQFATSCTHFLFNETFYDQIDGVAMGSPLAPVLANLFMGHNENIWLQNYDGNKPLYYRRYVDDTFCIFTCEKDATCFFSYLNQCHPNISFTMEKEKDNKLSFLDVLISKTTETSNCKTSVFHKTTYTGLLMNFFSFTSSSYKNGLIKTLIDRTYRINNTMHGFITDIKQLTTTLVKNQFPKYLINKIKDTYLKQKKERQPETKATELPATPLRYFKLPFIGKYSSLTQTKIRQLIRRYCNNIDIKLVFTAFKISNFFSNKDRIPFMMRSHIIYRFTCAGCNSCYVGETHRHLQTRISEHLHHDKNSNIYKHLHNSPNCQTSSKPDCFQVLDTATTKLQLRIKEGYYIQLENPELNKQKDHIIMTLSY